IANGYVTPTRCAEGLAVSAMRKTDPVFDIGCGTGLSAQALKALGFTCIDGTDLSPDMLALAEETGLYRQLYLGDLETPLNAGAGDYINMTAVGVFSPGHAPATLIDVVINRLPPGGCFVFSLNDHALADASYEAAIDRIITTGQAQRVIATYGPHLPAQNLRAQVCVLRRL
ncbi:MAG: methyltransferase domain-containing protein, partial [Pseudomonadota bacterium]